MIQKDLEGSQRFGITWDMIDREKKRKSSTRQIHKLD